MTRRLRAAAYLRISKTPEPNGMSVNTQQAQIKEYVTKHGWTLRPQHIYADIGSAKDNDRPRLQAMLTAAKQGRFEVLLISRLDRLVRSMVHWADLQTNLHTVRLVSLAENFDMTTPEGEAMANMLMTFAQLERRLVSARTRAVLQHRKAHGMVVGPIPFGFLRAGIGLQPDWPRLVIVDAMLTWRRKGATFRVIANHLNDQQIPTAQRRGRWHASTVRYILTKNAALYEQTFAGDSVRAELRPPPPPPPVLRHRQPKRKKKT